MNNANRRADTLIFVLCAACVALGATLVACGGARDKPPEFKREPEPEPQDDMSDENKLYHEACVGGDPVACHTLADSLKSEYEYEQAYRNYEKGCDGDYALSCAELGSAYDEGHNVERDYGRAHDYYKKACDLGDMPSCTALAVMYQAGNGVEVDLEKARALYTQACEGGHHYACDFKDVE